MLEAMENHLIRIFKNTNFLCKKVTIDMSKRTISLIIYNVQYKSTEEEFDKKDGCASNSPDPSKIHER